MKRNPEPAAAAVYSVHPGVMMTVKWIETLKAKTGRSLDEWVAVVAAQGPPTKKERQGWLKSSFQPGTNTAAMIADYCEGGAGHWDDTPEKYLSLAPAWVAAMFSGKKAHMRPLYEELLRLGKSLGDDVRVCPCQTIVPFYRHRVFAQIKPTTNARIDLGFAFGALPAEGRLIDTGGFAKKDRITHKVPIARMEDIDGEVTGLLRDAYDLDAEA